MSPLVEQFVQDDGVGLTLGVLTVTTLAGLAYRAARSRRGSGLERSEGDGRRIGLIDRILVLFHIPDDRQAYYSKKLALLETETLLRLLREMGDESR